MDPPEETLADLKILLASHEFHFKIEIPRLDAEHERLSRELEENFVNRRRLIREIEDIKKRMATASPLCKF
jgi:hypothetical protein